MSATVRQHSGHIPLTAAAVLLCGGLLTQTAAHAQSATKPAKPLALSLGYANDTKGDKPKGVSYGVSYDFSRTRDINALYTGVFAAGAHMTASAGDNLFNIAEKLEYNGAGLQARYYFARFSKDAGTYVRLGAGFFNVKLDGVDANFKAKSYSKTGAGFEGGVGVDFSSAFSLQFDYTALPKVTDAKGASSDSIIGGSLVFRI